MVKSSQIFPESAGRYFARFLGKGQYLMAGILHRSGLMAVNVPRRRGYDAFVLLQNRADDHRICLCSPDQKINLRLRTAAGLPDLFPRGLAVSVIAVSRQLLHIGVDQSAQDRLMGALTVIIFKI